MKASSFGWKKVQGEQQKGLSIDEQIFCTRKVLKNKEKNLGVLNV
jgi:hypothetical protein